MVAVLATDRFLCIFLFVCFGDKRPDPATIACPRHCECYSSPVEGYAMSLVCRGKTALRAGLISDHKVFTLAFDEVDANYILPLPYDCKRLQIHNLIIHKSGVTEKAHAVFDPTRKCIIDYITVTDSSGLDSWQWPVFGDTTKGIHIDSSTGFELNNVTKDIFDNVKYLESLTVTNCDISYISDGALDALNELRMISLAHNSLKVVKRKWLPTTMNNTWSIDLSHNQIKNIPDNFFTGYPALKEIKLNNNALKKIDMKQLGPIWSDLHEIWLQNNEFDCKKFNWFTCEAFGKVRAPHFFLSTNCQYYRKKGKRPETQNLMDLRETRLKQNLCPSSIM